MKSLHLLLTLLLLPFVAFNQTDTLRYTGNVTIIIESTEKDKVIVTAPVVTATKQPTQSDVIIGTNFGANIDHLYTKGIKPPQNCRIFHLSEKDSKDAALPRDYKYQLLPETNRGIGVEWNGSFLDGWNRYRAFKARNPNGILIAAWETIFPAGPEKGFPGKHWYFSDYAYVNGADGWQQYEKDLVYAKAYEYYYAWFVANGELVDYVSFNEWWDLTIEEFIVLEKAVFDARLAYNKTKGRTTGLRPQIGTNTLPLGQAGKYKISVEDLATTRIKEYDFIDVHVYPIDIYGRWKDDFSIVAEQLNQVQDFQRRHAPNTPIWITETGAPESYALNYYENLMQYVNENKAIQAVFSYAYETDDPERKYSIFKDLYMVDQKGDQTAAWGYLLGLIK